MTEYDGKEPQIMGRNKGKEEDTMSSFTERSRTLVKEEEKHVYLANTKTSKMLEEYINKLQDQHI